MSEDFKKRILSIPPEDEWWHSSNGETFIDLGQSLLDHGFTEKEAYNFLEDAYRSVADELGG